MDIVIVKELNNNNLGNNEPKTYIKSQGISQTVIQKPGVNNVNQINWDADYNGQVANLNLDVNTNGKKDNFTLQLSKGDLENLLNIPSIEKPLENRIEDDFLINEDFTPILQYKPQPYLFRTSVYPKSNTYKNHKNNIESQIKGELDKMMSQDEDSLKSEINNLLLLKKKLQHPYRGKHNHSHYKSHHTPVKRHHLTTTKKKKKTIKLHHQKQNKYIKKKKKKKKQNLQKQVKENQEGKEKPRHFLVGLVI